MSSDFELLHEGLPDLLPMQGRSDGTHVSKIIHYLCVKLGHYAPSTAGPDITRMGLGSALEFAIIAKFALQYPDRYLQPGELECDGIFGTPDLFDLKEKAVHEIKLTWMSSRHGPDSEKLWKYWVQVKAYCWMMETTKARLHIGYVNGDYKESDPIYRIWGRTYSERELAENWQMLKTHAALSEQETNSPRQIRSILDVGVRRKR